MKCVQGTPKKEIAMSEKLQKVLARAGLGSRREIEQWIEDGRLVVNGYPALLGTRVEPKDEVKLDGRRLKLIPESLVNRKILMYHKPEGEVTTRKDPEGRPTVFDRLPPMRGSRWVAIGRLDLNTSGLLLFTNDGEVANRLMHPSHEVEREYAVRILGELKPSQRKALLEGVVLEDGLAKFNSIESRGGGGSNRWYHVTLSEGRTREVRRMFESLDLVVSRLIRVRYGPVSLDPLLKQGMNRVLTLDETNRLCEAVGVEPQAPRAERRREYQHTRRSEPMTGRGPAADYDDDVDDDENEVAPRAAARKPKVIGSKDDDLPLDRVERAAELLRRRRAAESAGVEFSGRNRRLSGKRTLRESELRRIAEEKAAAKKLGSAGTSSTGRVSRGKTATVAGNDEAPRQRRVAAAAGSRSKPSGARTSTRSDARPEGRSSGRAAPVRSSARFDRDEETPAPRRSAPASRSARAADDEAPRRRSAAKPASKFASSERTSRGGTGERSTRSRTAAAGSERTGRASSARSGSRDTAARSESPRSTAARGAAPRGTASRTGSSKADSGRTGASRAGSGKADSRGSSSRTGSPRSANPRSSDTRTTSARVAAGKSKPASRSAAAKPARSSGTKSATGSRSGGRAAAPARGGARPSAGKGKRTR
jgi:23S rRNA pseudouridine2605 synthase